MGWLFGKKKVQPKVPFPEGRPLEGSLSFPGRSSRERIIEPDEVKAAAGLEKPLAFPRMESPSPFSFSKSRETFSPPGPAARPELPIMNSSANVPLFLKLDAYQQLLTELNALKATIASVNVTALRYNEEEEFIKLRKSVKGLHDKLISIDKMLFKTGDGNAIAYQDR